MCDWYLLYFWKAFETVNHSKLLEKLYHYGIRGNALVWFRSYLSDRSQYVLYNGVGLTTKLITCGVPQGSILGPLLFLIYINDLYDVCHESVSILFADDTNLFDKGNKFDLAPVPLEINLMTFSKSHDIKIVTLVFRLTKQISWHSASNVRTLISWHWGVDVLLKVNFW